MIGIRQGDEDRTQSLDATEMQARAEQEAKEYKGEFYPVAKPGGKHPE